MKKSILFVDDEANVLSGLRRMLRGQREEWDCEFADSGQAALALIAERDGFDVIVTDMRMPGMDGAQLLEQVKQVSPRTVRLVLSGQSDQELTMKAVGPAHQFLSKPCDAETLVNVIKRACALRDRLAPGGLTNLVSQLDRLPSMPGIYRRLVHELQSPDVGVAEVGRIIAEDPAMTSKILQLVNSSFFCFQQRISDPVQAAMILGINTIKALVLSVHVFGQLAVRRAGGAAHQRPAEPQPRHRQLRARDRAVRTRRQGDGRRSVRGGTAARHRAPGDRGQPARHLPSGDPAGPAAGRHPPRHRAGGVRRHARRGGRLPARPVGSARDDRGGRGLPSRAGRLAGDARSGRWRPCTRRTSSTTSAPRGARTARRRWSTSPGWAAWRSTGTSSSGAPPAERSPTDEVPA